MATSGKVTLTEPGGRFEPSIEGRLSAPKRACLVVVSFIGFYSYLYPEAFADAADAME